MLNEEVCTGDVDIFTIKNLINKKNEMEDMKKILGNKRNREVLDDSVPLPNGKDCHVNGHPYAKLAYVLSPQYDILDELNIERVDIKKSQDLKKEKDQKSNGNLKILKSVIREDSTVKFIKPELGRIIDSYRTRKIKIPLRAEIEKAGKINTKLLNNVITKLVMLPTLDASSIRSIIAYINREEADLDIMQHILPLISMALEKVATTEEGIMLMTNSKLCQDINSMRKGEYTYLPTSLYQAFKQGKTLMYLGYLLKSPFQSVANNENDRKNFQ